jgi:hypothetical protein
MSEALAVIIPIKLPHQGIAGDRVAERHRRAGWLLAFRHHFPLCLRSAKRR